MNSMNFKLNTFHLIMKLNLFSKMLTNTLYMDTLHWKPQSDKNEGDKIFGLCIKKYTGVWLYPTNNLIWMYHY